MRHAARTLTALAALTWTIVPALPAAAQQSGMLTLPLADLNAPRLSAAILSTDLFAPENGGRFTYVFADSARDYRDTQAAVSLGQTLRLLEGDVGRCRAALGADGAVFARFRLRAGSRSNVSDDWWIAAPVALRCGRGVLRVRYRHHSAHLGDDVVADFHAQTYTWSHEFVDALASAEMAPGLSLYAGGGRALHTQVPGEHYEWTAGLDGRRRVGRAGLLLAGFEADGADRPGAHTRLSFVAGAQPSIAPLLLPVRILVRRVSGGSTAGQLDGSREHYWALEIAFVP